MGKNDGQEMDQELSDLRKEMDSFKKEKERVRQIIGQIGGMPSFNVRIFNIIFIVFIVVCFVLSLISKEATMKLLLLDVAIVSVSIKLIVLMHYQTKVSHFQLWILSSLEWRINEVTKLLRTEMKKEKEKG